MVTARAWTGRAAARGALAAVLLALAAAAAQAQTPAVGIQTESGTVYEGGSPFAFTVRASTAAPIGGLRVSYTASYAMDSVFPQQQCTFARFVPQSALGNKRIVIAAGATTATIRVPITPSDSVLETETECFGRLTMEIKAGSGYTVEAGSGSTASTRTRDDLTEGAYIKLSRSGVFPESAGTATVRATLLRCSSFTTGQSRTCTGTTPATAAFPVYQGIEVLTGSAVSGYATQQAGEEDVEVAIEEVRFEPGQSTLNVPIRIRDDAILEGYLAPDGLREVFAVRLQNEPDMAQKLRHSGNEGSVTILQLLHAQPQYILDDATRRRSRCARRASAPTRATPSRSRCAWPRARAARGSPTCGSR